MEQWDRQCPPAAKHQNGKVSHITKNQGCYWKGSSLHFRLLPFSAPSYLLVFSSDLLEFGPYLREKEECIASYKKTIDPLKEFPPENHRPPYKPTKPIPAVKVRIVSLYNQILVVASENDGTQIILESPACMKVHVVFLVLWHFN